MRVKRILLAAGLALAIHGLFLGTEGRWLKSVVPSMEKSGPLTMTLVYVQPGKPVGKPSVEKEDTKPDKAVPVVEPEPKRPSPPKPLPPKRPPKRRAPEKVPAKVGKMSPSLSSPMPKQSETPPPASAHSRSGRAGPVSEENASSIGPAGPGDLPQEEGLQAAIGGAPGPTVPLVTEAIPDYRSNPSPPYPRRARIRGYEGTTVLEVLVNSEGRVGDLKVCKSSGYTILDKAALDAVKGWAFQPGMKADRAVDMWVKVPIRFQLK
jgi:protein TonB